jgi:hypothetical protein
MDTIILIGVGLTTIGFAMVMLLMYAAKRPKRHAASGDSSWMWSGASGFDGGGGGSDCDSGGSDGGSCDGGGGDGGGGGGD